MSAQMPPPDEILALIDRLEDLLERSDLAELEVQAGELGILLRKPGGQFAGPESVEAEGAHALASGSGADGGSGSHGAGEGGRGRGPGNDPSAAPPQAEQPASANHLVVAPLTGVYYGSPSPGAAPYVKVGAEIVAGQVIGLIEAMKLFNEIKSDAAGRVVRIHAQNGVLVRARQPLIEIEPS
jgi:acetyl-CoA carboxylase biotin carboxyl carrier protein